MNVIFSLVNSMFMHALGQQDKIYGLLVAHGFYGLFFCIWLIHFQFGPISFNLLIPPLSGSNWYTTLI